MKFNHNHKFINGFTLLEILIALMIFAIIAAMTSSAIYYAFNIRERINIQSELLGNIQMVLTLLEKDIKQVISRSVSNNNINYPAFIGRIDYIEFTRDGLFISSNNKNTHLQRIAFKCNHNKLIRRSWTTLDTPKRDSFIDQIMLENVKKCQFSFLDTKLQIIKFWPKKTTTKIQSTEVLPKAIKFDLSLPKFGDASLLFILPAALYQ